MSRATELHTIVVATDLSEPANAAIARAAEIAHRSGARLVLVHAVAPLPPPAPEFLPVPAPVYEDLRRSAEQQLRLRVDSLRGAGLEAEGIAVTEQRTPRLARRDRHRPDAQRQGDGNREERDQREPAGRRHRIVSPRSRARRCRAASPIRTPGRPTSIVSATTTRPSRTARSARHDGVDRMRSAPLGLVRVVEGRSAEGPASRPVPRAGVRASVGGLDSARTDDARAGAAVPAGPASV